MAIRKSGLGEPVEPERVRCFCLPGDFGSGRRKALKGSESVSNSTGTLSRSSKFSSYQSMGSFPKSKSSGSDSSDSNSRSKGLSIPSSGSHVKSRGSDIDTTSSTSVLSCLRAPETDEFDSEMDTGSVRKLRWFPYKELEIATNRFSQSKLVPRVSFKMYRGTLASGETVDVRRLAGVPEHRFRKEVEIQSRLEHENLLRLIGFSDDQGELLLVSESVSCGTLDDHLQGPSGCSLPWKTRRTIALGVARAITYLLWTQNPPIIHQDLRPKNIFLGTEFVPKVASYISLYNCSEIVAAARSWEYHDPESSSQVQTQTCNVYSFGVIFLQLLTGRPTRDPRTNESLVDRARRYQRKAQEENFETIRLKLDPLIADQPAAELEACWNLALRCVMKDCDGRPTMEEVVEALENLNEHA